MKIRRSRIAYVIYGLVIIVFLGLVGLGIGWGLGLATRTTSAGTATQTLQHIETPPLPTVMEVGLAPTATPPMPPVVASPTAMPTPTQTPTPTPIPFPFEDEFVYGNSIEGRPLQAYRLGTGESARFIIGAIHGGYEWNTVEVISKTLEYFRANPEQIPAGVALYLIPCANPDGYAAGTDAVVARMNANGVDLNRNWDYAWQPMATHGTRPVKAGDAPFSEPETAALRDVLLRDPLYGRPAEAVIFYHSAMGVVFSGADRETSATFELTEAISAATGYRHQTEGVPGQITTGDAIDWLSTVGIAGTEIELTTHARISEAEWQRNLRGIQVFLEWRLPIQPAPVTAVDTPEGYVQYTIRSGDLLSTIAYEKCEGRISIEELAAINGIANPNWIAEWQVILIPAYCK